MMQKLGSDDLGGELRFSNYGGKRTYFMFNLLKGFIIKNIRNNEHKNLEYKLKHCQNLMKMFSFLGKL